MPPIASARCDFKCFFSPAAQRISCVFYFSLSIVCFSFSVCCFPSFKIVFKPILTKTSTPDHALRQLKPFPFMHLGHLASIHTMQYDVGFFFSLSKNLC